MRAKAFLCGSDKVGMIDPRVQKLKERHARLRREQESRRTRVRREKVLGVPTKARIMCKISGKFYEASGTCPNCRLDR